MHQLFYVLIVFAFQAIDIWMSTCLVFVFAAFIEYSFVNLLARKQMKKDQLKRDEMRRDEMRDEAIRLFHLPTQNRAVQEINHVEKPEQIETQTEEDEKEKSVCIISCNICGDRQILSVDSNW